MPLVHKTMEIRLLTPYILRKYADDELTIDIEQLTIGALLAEVRRLHPALYTCICDESGKLRQHINLFVGNDLASRDYFDTKLHPGDVVSVYQSVSGG
ncbi:MAG: MoaD/ThiS family protein [Planctomycetales bacterium]|nr:MoaD/ThiS family protein [Planctomycetales bacterium]